MEQPEKNELPADFSKIEAVAQQEAESVRPKKRGRPTKEEEQLFGHRRQTRTVWHCIKISYLIAFAAVVLLAVFSLFWNWFAPERLRWLAPDQLADAQKFLFSGTIGGVSTFFFSAALGKQRSGD